MIRSWRNAATRKVWEGGKPNQFRGLDFEAAIDLLLALNVAKSLRDLSPLKSVGRHKLKGERNGTGCASRSLSQARAGGAWPERKPTGARPRWALGPHNRHSQRTPL